MDSGLCYSRAAIEVPPLVVMEEPTSGLDPGNQARVLELVELLCAQHKTAVLFVTYRDEERDFWQTASAALAYRSLATRASGRG